MNREYVRPTMKSIDTLSFETVCAGSGIIVCPNNRTNIDAASLQCQLCIDSHKPWQDYFDAAGPNTQDGRIMGAHAAVEKVGYCPGGLSTFA